MEEATLIFTDNHTDSWIAFNKFGDALGSN